jgi:hypothetical protein
MNIDRAIEILDKTLEVTDKNWKPAVIGAGVGAVGAALFWFWLAR